MTRMHLGVMANDETQESVDLDSNEILFVLNNFYVYSIHIYSSPPYKVIPTKASSFIKSDFKCNKIGKIVLNFPL